MLGYDLQPIDLNRDQRARSAILVRYATNQKACKLWDRNIRRVIFSRDVPSDESKELKNLEPLLKVLKVPGNLDLNSHHLAPCPELVDSQILGKEQDRMSTIPERDSLEAHEWKRPEKDHRFAGRLGRGCCTPGELGKSHSALIIEVLDTPWTFLQAPKGEESSFWADAVRLEMDSLKKSCKWILVPRELVKNILTSKLISKKKMEVKSSCRKTKNYKGRLVTHDFRQLQSSD